MIRDFYQGRTILLTGGTGFYGQALVAKILRDLPGVARLYLLVRSRKQADGRIISAGERLEEDLFARDVFSRFRREDPQGFAAARQKVAAVEGDLTLPALGLEEEVRQQLLAEVDLIIAPGATVVFDEPLDRSILLNTLGPQKLLEFASQGCRQVVFVHVSTAYVSGRRSGSIPEQPLPLDRNIAQMMAGGPVGEPFDPEAEVAACQALCRQIHARAQSPEQQAVFRREILSQSHNRRLSEKRLEKLVDDRGKRWIERQLVEEGMRRARLYGWNDVYTFTKALGEQLLVRRRGGVPLVIVRPSITESSLADPEPGWIFGLKVAEPLIIAYGRGLLPDFPTRRDLIMDLVPIDVVVNLILAAPTRATVDEVRVFHAATSSENPLFMEQLVEYVRGYFLEHPLPGRNGQVPVLPEWTFPSLRRFRWRFACRYLYPLRAARWLLDRLPEKLAPAQQRRRLAALDTRLRRVLYYTDLFSPYTTLDCCFEFKQSGALFASLPEEEQRLFSMDVGRIDWKRYFQEIHLPGLRRFVLKEEGAEEELLRETPEEVGAEEERWQIEESIETIPDLLRWAGARYGEKVALQMAEGGRWRRYTYAQLQGGADSLALTWQQQGLQAGERVLLYARNSPEWVIAYLGASSLGLTVVPLDPQTRVEEIWALAEFAEVRGLIASEACYAQLPAAEVAARGAAGLRFLNLQNAGLPFGAPPAGEAAPPEGRWKPPTIDPQQVASILFTAGPLVQPRGVMLTHRNFVADLLALAEVHRVYETDQLLSLLPLHHCLEFTGGLLMPLLGGATITYLEALNSREILGTMRATGTTVLLTVPRLLKILGDRVQRQAGSLEAGPASPELESLRKLRLVVCGGAPLALEIFDMYQGFGVTICEGYGLTEAGPIVAVSPPEGGRRGSVGQALPRVELAVADPEGRGEGEILVRGANVTSGYYRQPELTATILADGWLHTGDLGRLDEDGYLYITGRCKDLVVTGAGKNVYPQEVETLYGKLPQVAELGVVGVLSPRTLSEEVHGVAVLESRGETAGGEEGLMQAVRERVQQLSRTLPSYQRIRQLHIRRRPLPRLDDGEVDRAALRAELLEPRPRDQAADQAPLLPAWEQEVYRQISQITGLSLTEVAVHAQTPLDTLLDSLMAVEFTAFLEVHLEVRLPPIDRSNQTLRQLLDQLAPDLAGKLDQLQKVGTAGSYWSRELAAEEEETGEGRRTGPDRGVFYRLAWAMGRPLFKYYFSLQAQGLEHLPQDRPYLLAANHASHLDALAVLTAVYPFVEDCRLMAAKDYFFRLPLRGWLMRNFAHAVPFDRYGNFRESLVKARSMLGKRQPLLIFPEGTRSPSGLLQPFKLGIGLLAFELEVPIVPVHIRGTYEALPKGGRRPGRKPISLRFGPALEMGPFRAGAAGLSSYEIYRQIVEQLRGQIEDLAAPNQ